MGDNSKLDDDNMFGRLPPFDKLPADKQLELSHLSEAKEVSAGTQLIEEQAEDVTPFIPLKGRIALRKIGVNGKSLTNHFLVPGDIFQVILSLQDSPFPFAAKAERDSTLLYLPKANLQTVLFDNPYIYESFNSVLQERLEKVEEMARAIAYDKVEERVALILSLMVGRISKYDRKNDQHVIDLTRQELSDLTGTTTETAIRVTKDLESEGILDVSETSHIRILDLDALEHRTSSLLVES